MVPLTAEQVSRVAGARPAEAQKYLPFLQGACKAYDITTGPRIAAFLSQIGHESSGLSRMVESLDYSVEALLKNFGRHRISEADARKYGRTPYQKAHQEAIANCIYGGRWGLENLGNVKPGDGWRYRGRGAKQLTGLDNYRRCGDALGEDFVNFPDRLLMPVNAILSAGWFWHENRLNRLADKGDVIAMTEVVNGGRNGLARREQLYLIGLEVFA